MKCLLLLFPALALSADPPKKVPYDPDESYAEQKMRGWVLRVNKDLLKEEHRKLREDTLELLDDHLYRITRVVPAPALEKIRKIPIWIEVAHPKHPCMCYHVSRDWLRSNGMNPNKAGGVELANCKNFLSWTHAQPWMVFHELAHGYHHQVLGFDHAGVKACFDQAKEMKIYEKVMHISGRKQKHYALTNTHEYFAELSESYFGTNDFYPFVKAELKEVDPRMHELLEKVWGVRR